jgi:DNA gyrase subunit A
MQIRAKYKIDGDTIVFTEIPYSTTYEAIVDKIVDFVKDGKIKEITDIHDKMGINGQGIEITVKKNTNKELFIEKLYKMTPLQSPFSCNFNLIVNGEPQVLGVKQIVHEWLLFRANTKFDIDRKEHKKRMLIALKQVLLDIDKAINIIRETKNNSETISMLMAGFDIDEEQAEYVSEIKLRHINKEYLINRIEEINTIEKEINGLNKILDDRKVMAKLIISQLKSVKDKYGQERKSQIIEVKELTKEKADAVSVDNYNVKVFVSAEGYLKKIPLTSLRGNFDIKVKDGDRIIKEIETTNNSDILVFTDKQNVYKYKSYELEDHKPSVLGEYIPTLLNLKDERAMFVTATNDYKGNIIIGFEDGKVAKIDISAYETKQNRAMLKNAYANKKVLFFNHIIDDIDIVALSSINKVLLFNTSMINSKTSKTTIGVQILKSKNDSNAVLYRNADDSGVSFADAEYYRISNAGVGKYLKKEDMIEY